MRIAGSSESRAPGSPSDRPDLPNGTRGHDSAEGTRRRIIPPAKIAAKPRLAVVSFFFRCGTESSVRATGPGDSTAVSSLDRMPTRSSLQPCGKQPERESERVGGGIRALGALSVDSPRGPYAKPPNPRKPLADLA